MNEEEFLEFLREIQEQEYRQGVIYVLNVNKMREMKSVFLSLSDLLSNLQAEATVEYGIDDLSKGGYISIHFGNSFQTADLIHFAECLSTADNAEINITFRSLNIDLMFNGVFQAELMN